MLAASALVAGTAATRAQPAATVEITAPTPGPIGFGQSINFTAMLYATYSNNPTPDGVMTFYDGADAISPPVPVATLGVGQAFSAGSQNTCAIYNLGGNAACWGEGASGQLGTGSTVPWFSPQPVNPGNPAAYKAIAVGRDFTCAVTVQEGVKCWGDNSRGQLGIGANVASIPFPVDVVDLNAPVHAIAAGPYHVCVLTRVGGVKCWGDTGGGKLGIGTLPNNDFRNTPVDVVGLSRGAIAIASKESRTCVLMDTGGVKCWGFNGDGLLAGGTDDRLVPVDIPGLEDVTVTSVTVGQFHICVLTSTGGVKCWGHNGAGQLGNGTASPTMTTTPADVLGLTSGAAAISAGSAHTCALLSNGGVKCWGDNAQGQLGTGGSFEYAPTNYVNGMSSGALNITTGDFHTCALYKPAFFVPQIMCWGQNNIGQLGDGTNTSPRTTPVPTFVNPLLVAKASFTTSALGAGSRSIKAAFSDDTTGLNDADETMTIQVDQAATTTALNVTPNPSSFGQALEFTATVTGGPSNTGSIKFKDGATVLLTIPLGLANPGQAAIGFSGSLFAMGPHSFTAEYISDGNYAASTSPPVAHTVNGTATSTSLSGTPAATRPGESVAFTATVSSGSGTPTGTVTFKEGSTVFGSSPLAAGVATLNVTSLTIGSHTVTAQYAASGTFAGSSGAANHVVDAREGAEARISQFNVTGKRQLPAIARTGKGYVTIWQSDSQDGSAGGIFGQRYKNDGSKLGGEFRVNTTTDKAQTLPAVSGLKDGGFVVAWTSSGQDGGGAGIVAQRYQSNGAKSGAEFIVNTTIKGNQTRPAVAGLSDGDFVIAWDGPGDGSGLSVFAQRFAKTGKPVGAEIQVNTTKGNNQISPAVAAAGDGGFVVAWESASGDTGEGIFAQRFNANNSPLGFEFRVNTRKAGDQTAPVAAGLGDGGFVVVWTSDGQDGDGLGVYGQRFLANGNKLGGEFRANTRTALDQYQPAVAGFDSSGFAVVWTSVGQDGDGLGVYGQLFGSDGVKVDAEFRANTTISKNQWQPAVATLSTGALVAVWTWSGPDGSLQGIYGQRFSVDVH